MMKTPTSTQLEQVMISVHVFEGGAGVTEDNSVSAYDWTEDELKRVVSDFHGTDDWVNEPIEWADPNGPKTLGESFEIVSDNLAQVVKCGEDGGMIYIVRG